MKRKDRMSKQQRKQAYATNMLLEHVRLDPITGTVNPSDEAIRAAKQSVDENPK